MFCEEVWNERKERIRQWRLEIHVPRRLIGLVTFLSFGFVEPRNKRRLNKIQVSIWVQICSIQLSAVWDKTPST